MDRKTVKDPAEAVIEILTVTKKQGY